MRLESIPVLGAIVAVIRADRLLRRAEWWHRHGLPAGADLVAARTYWYRVGRPALVRSIILVAIVAALSLCRCWW